MYYVTPRFPQKLSVIVVLVFPLSASNISFDQMTSVHAEELLRIVSLIKKVVSFASQGEREWVGITEWRWECLSFLSHMKLDFEGSQAAERFIVNRGIDSVLDESKGLFVHSVNIAHISSFTICYSF